MSKKTKTSFNLTEALDRKDKWLNGTNTAFKAGQVVERNEGKEIGVIAYLLTDVETYRVKWHKGPNPWDFIEGQEFGHKLKLSDKPNPLTYKTSQRYPGPSSTQIDKLNSAFKASTKEKTAKEVEQYIQILEEQIVRVKENKSAKDEIDSIVDETLDADPAPIVDSIDIKRKQIIEEE